MNNNVMNELNEILPQGSILLHEPMNRHTTFQIGGPADCMLQIETVEQLKKILPLLKENKEPYFLLGNGSNLLVSDEGYRGIILQLTGDFAKVTVDGDCVQAGAGVLLSKTAKEAADHSLTGLEFAAGIPGTVGGAAVMNAGAYGGEMKQVVTDVTIMKETGEVQVLSNEDMQFAYRNSAIKNTGDVVLSVRFALQPGDQEEILATMKDLAGKRREKQPLEYPSAGSTFKRPEGYFAGKLIMDAGLRGYQVGGAQVAEKHCGFVINKDHATAKDVKNLMDHIRVTVEKECGVTLEKEIIFLGEV